jgi:hypothetical protein
MLDSLLLVGSKERNEGDEAVRRGMKDSLLLVGSKERNEGDQASKYPPRRLKETKSWGASAHQGDQLRPNRPLLPIAAAH